MNYEQLRAAIQTYALDFEPSFVKNVDTFIHLGEARLRLNVRLPNFRKDLPSTLQAGEQLWDTPEDFLAPDSVQVFGQDGSINLLLNKDSEFIDECYPNQNIQGLPRFYCYLNESSLKLGPTPDYGYSFQLGYFYEPPSITVAGTSWLGDHFEHALLSGSLVEAAKYLKNQDDFARYDQAWKEDLQMDQAYNKGRTKKDTYEQPDQRASI